MTIDEARHIAGLTKPEMAELLNVPFGTVRTWCELRAAPPRYIEEMTIDKLLRHAEEKYNIEIIRKDDDDEF